MYKVTATAAFASNGVCKRRRMRVQDDWNVCDDARSDGVGEGSSDLDLYIDDR